MSEILSIRFPPFRLDLRSQRLWRGPEELALKPKTIEMLHYLATNPRRLVSKEEILSAVWGDTQISGETVRSTLRELRRALDEDAKAPHIIETVHGRGYRFIAAVDEMETTDDSPSAPATPSLVGRESALIQLREWYTETEGGRRQVAFLVGEAGIGKTSLVEQFLGELRQETSAICAHGQCIGRYGDSEPYMPILEALGRLCRQSGGGRWVEVLERHAPTWLAEMPGLLEPEDLRRLKGSALRINRDRMLRELSDAVEAICSHQPVVLVLEDLHWSDPATLDAIDTLARRTEPARLMLVGTHRPSTPTDGTGTVSRLVTMRAELHLHHFCRDLSLELITEGDTRTYLEHRFPGVSSGPLAAFLYGRSEGNPLMMVSYADELARTGRLVEGPEGWRIEGDPAELSIPHGVRQMVEHQIDQLTPEEQRALETASVGGVRFDSETLIDADPEFEDVDDYILRVARERGLVRVGTGSSREFVHALYQEVLYERVAPARRRRLHRKLGLQIERIHASNPAPVAAELAMHFERGRDPERMIRYQLQTAEVAIQRSSHEEAAVLLRRANKALKRRPETPERGMAEFSVLAKLGNCLSITKGYVDPEVREAYARALELSAELDEYTPELTSVLAGLCGFYEVRGEHGPAAEVTLRQLQVAETTGDAYDRVTASLSRGIVCFSIGEHEEAAERLSISRRDYDVEAHSPGAQPSVTDPLVTALGHGSLVFGALGQLDKARAWIEEARAHAAALRHPPSIVLASYYALTFYQLLRDADRAADEAEACVERSLEHGFPFYIPAALVVWGWARALKGQAEEGAQQATQGVAILRDAGANLGQPLYCALLAEAYGAAGDIEAGLGAVGDGVRAVEQTGEIVTESFLHWARGDLLVRRARIAPAPHDLREAEACFEQSIAAALRCSARTQVLGPAVSLARVWSEGGRTGEAKTLLDTHTRGFASSFPVPVLEEARAVLAAL